MQLRVCKNVPRKYEVAVGAKRTPQEKEILGKRRVAIYVLIAPSMSQESIVC